MIDGQNEKKPFYLTDEKTERNAKGHYVDKDKFLAEMTAFWEQCEKERQKAAKKGIELDRTELPPPNNYIGQCIFDIARNYAKAPNWAFYPYVEDMIGDAIENCLTYIHNWDPNKGSNPFAYFTQFCYYAFIKRIEKEKKQAQIKFDAIREMDSRGTFDQWLKREGFEGTPEERLADYLKIPSRDIAENQSIGGKKPKKPKTGKMTELMNKTKEKKKDDD
jgi:hypothetical protein